MTQRQPEAYLEQRVDQPCRIDLHSISLAARRAYILVGASSRWHGRVAVAVAVAAAGRWTVGDWRARDAAVALAVVVQRAQVPLRSHNKETINPVYSTYKSSLWCGRCRCTAIPGATEEMACMSIRQG